jgi:hypothetical protein
VEEDLREEGGAVAAGAGELSSSNNITEFEMSFQDVEVLEKPVEHQIRQQPSDSDSDSAS